MKPTINRVLMAYRPLYLHGLLLDGQYRLPSSAKPATTCTQRTHRRHILMALTGLLHGLLPSRSQR